MTLEEAIRRVRQASRRLQPGQGDRARRNARTAVKQALAGVARVMDREFPRPAIKRTVRSRILNPSRQNGITLRRVVAAGLVEIDNNTAMRCALADIKLREIKILNHRGEVSSRPIIAPKWVLLAKNLTELKKLKNDRKARVRAEALQALGAKENDNG